MQLFLHCDEFLAMAWSLQHCVVGQINGVIAEGICWPEAVIMVLEERAFSNMDAPFSHLCTEYES